MTHFTRLGIIKESRVQSASINYRLLSPLLKKSWFYF